MSIAAIFVSATQFTVVGDQTVKLPHGLAVKALQGVDGNDESSVSGASYAAGTGLTTVTLHDAILTANLATIQLGQTYADPDNSTSNIGPHYHKSKSDGGTMEAASMTSAQRAVLDSLPLPALADAGKAIVINATGDGYDKDSAAIVHPTGTGFAHITDDVEDAAAKLVVNADVDPAAAIVESKFAFDKDSGHTHDGTGSKAVDHTTLSNKGTNTHAQIDTFIGTKAQASGLASLDGGSKVVQEPASKAQANGIASLNADTKVVEDPANATDTPTASKIPIADGSAKLDGWVSDAAAGTKGKVQLAGDLGGTAAAPLVVGIKESGGQDLSLGAIADGQFLVRSGTSVVGAAGTGGPAPATTVTDETTWGVTPAAGTATNYAREDHTHGTPAEPTGGGGGGMSLDGYPIPFEYSDATHIIIPDGPYYLAGYRLKGYYRDTTNMGTRIDVAAPVTLDVTGASLQGGKVNSSWYSVWMIDESTFLVLPFIRVDTITYSAPNTVITPAAHADGTTAEDGFVSADDDFNTYRLMQLCDTAYNGTIHTVVDSVNGTPDQILITGDVTSQILAGQWLQMMPAAGTACLYLGDIKFDSSGNLKQFFRDRWAVTFAVPTVVGANKATSFDQTELGGAIPPTAKKMTTLLVISSSGSSAQLVAFYLAAGSTETDTAKAIVICALRLASATTANQAYLTVTVPITVVTQMRNLAKMDSSAATTAYFQVIGYEG